MTPIFKNTAFDNPDVDALTFRDARRLPVKYNTGELPDATPLWSPRVGFNWDVIERSDDAGARRHRRLHGQAAVRLDLEPDRQHRCADSAPSTSRNTTARPFNPEPDSVLSRSPSTGAPAASFELERHRPGLQIPADVAEQHRASIASCRGASSAPASISTTAISTASIYINANLPAPQSAFAGVDNRPRWVGSVVLDSADASDGPCVTNRINNAAGNQVTADYVIKNQNIGRSWNVSGSSDEDADATGFSAQRWLSATACRGTRSTPGSTACGIVRLGDTRCTAIRTSRRSVYSSNSPGHRVVRQRVVHEAVLRARRDDDLGVLGR